MGVISASLGQWSPLLLLLYLAGHQQEGPPISRVLLKVSSQSFATDIDVF